MSDPTLSNQPFLCFYSPTRGPTADEPVIDNQGIYTDPNWLFSWWNQSLNDVFLCVNDQSNQMLWKRILLSDVDENGVGAPLAISNGGTSSTDAASARKSLGFDLNSSRDYARSSVSNFGDVSKPNDNQDILVIASVQMKNASDTFSQITAHINGETGEFIVATIGMESMDGTQTQTMTFIVPEKSSYHLEQNGNGENTLLSVYELLL